ncbi:DNA glycosylase/AP lyase ROS1-like [Henckelia pumila]|uniref:DNA glycosylase/AP lyase ROS1-like n=1 Tax=Henckelia pumila TaxID=405737 RepID=UPI003C6DD5AC
MAEELKDDGDWVPVTPAKTAQEYSPVDSGKERDRSDRILGRLSAADACFANVSGNSDKAEYEEARKVEAPLESIKGSWLNDEQAHHNFGSDSTISKTSDTPGHPNSEKLGSCGVRLNKKKRPKVKKHRPRVFDETKPKKIPKSQTVNPLTPKQKTSRRSIPRTSPLEEKKCMRKENPPEVFDGTRKSCRRELDFNHEIHVNDQHGHIDGVTNSKFMETSFAKDEHDEHVQMVDGFQGLTNFPNACTETSLRDSLEDILKLDLEEQDFDFCPGIQAIVQRYQLREKTRSNPLCQEDLNFEEKINAPEGASKMHCGTRFKVYKRIFRPDECLKNSRKLGPNFPRIFKKKRMKRERATKFQMEMDLCITHKVTSTKRSKSNKPFKKIMKRCPSTTLVDGMHQERAMDNELSTNFVMKEDCAWSANIRKKRSQTRGGKNKICCGGKPLEPQGYTSILTWSVQHKRKRSNIYAQSRVCLVPTDFEAAQSRVCLVPMDFPSKAGVKENVEDLVEISIKQIETPISVGQHLDLKNMFLNLNAHEIRGMTDFICQRFESLCISDVNNQLVLSDKKSGGAIYNQLVLRNQKTGGAIDKQLVLRDQKAGGAIFAYEGKFDLLRRRKLLPKVDLDAETLRVWKLLMETDGTEDTGEGEDETKKDWDNLREMFRGRMESFISCMHHIQGDRRFSPWKGSVVDSVIGVFLTQNVSDHLSSSAFMSLAAKFPPSMTKRSNSNKNNVGHQESVDIDAPRDQSTHENNEEPCLCSTKQDMRQICSCAKTTSSQLRTSKNFAVLKEVLHGEETMSHQQINNQEEDKISCDESIIDTKSGDACAGSISCKSRDTISRPCTGENSAFFNHEEIADVKYGDTAPVIPDSSAHKSSTTIARPCSSENAYIFRQDLLVEEDTFLQQYYRHEDNKTSCDESVANLKFRTSQSDTSASKPDDISDLDDLGNININGLPNVGKNRESAGGRNKRVVKEKQESPIKWDDLREQYSRGKSKDPVNDNIDSADWEAVRQASVEEVAKVIMNRGMNNILAGRIKDFLDRMIEDHGAIDLEWLRDVPPDKAKDYLLSIPGLGLKSTECVRLLTLRHHAFPVDTNVGRILVRLGWVPLLPLPEDVQIHLLNNYPLVDTIQKYIWPRLCKISNQTLYECHYQMITFGKVFCTKRQPNCNACPMRGQCRHFASAYASARLRLPGVQGGSNESEPQVKSSQNAMDIDPPLLVHCDDDVSRVGDICLNSEPIVEFPPSPEPAAREMAERDIEDFGYESEDEIPPFQLNQEEFSKNLQDFIEKTNLLNGEATTTSKELVVLSPEAASIPMPKLKFVGRLRTVHQVYEIPDSHPLLAGFEKREPDDPCPYLLAIWTNECSQPPKSTCSCRESMTCDVCACCLRDEVQTQNDESIQGTMLIPCRTANRGSFPLNGTYFQVNEVFADHESSHRPISVPRKWIWRLRRRSLYCGTSTTSIFRGMTTDEIQYCFWRGFICVRATDRVTRAPRPLGTRFHVCKTRVLGDE